MPQEQSRWASHFLTEEQVHEMFPQGWCPTPAFVHEQACGKLRRIDNAKAGGSNFGTAFAEQISMSTAMQPAIYAKLALSEADLQGDTLDDDQLEHGNEDQPDAYRGLPVDEKDLSCNIVMIKDPGMAIVF